MDHFQYRGGIYHAEEVNLEVLASKVGTPFYCYSNATLQHHYTIFAQNFAADALICYAVKANPNPTVIQALAALGAGADVVSEGEIRLALAGGVDPRKIVFSGVGKMRSEMQFALAQDIYQFNVESLPELLALNAVAAGMERVAAIALRVNPDIDAQTHAKISTGSKETKFGIAMRDALPIYRQAAAMSNIRIQGVSMHIGSQLTNLAPFSEAFRRMRAFVGQLRAENISVETVDLGGGLGIPYGEGEILPSPSDYAATVKEVFSDVAGRLIFEPGRMLVGNAGILVSRVLYVKNEQGRNFIILDAGMNDLMRPALYDAYHDILPVHENTGEKVRADIVGPVCETSDIFARQREIVLPKEGDLMLFRTCGAYGASMANSYNARPIVPEVLVNGDRYAVIRPRQTYDDLLGATQSADWQ